MFSARLAVVVLATGLMGSAAVVHAAVQYTITDLAPVAGDWFCNAYGLNNNGDVVGESIGPQGYQAVIWRNGVTTGLADLGAGMSSGVGQINDAGVVVGWSNPSGTSNGQKAFSWTQLGGYRSMATSIAANSVAYSINNSGVIAGYVPSSPMTAISWTGGTPSTIAALAGRDANVQDINDAGQIAGQMRDGSGQMHAYRVSGGQVVDLGALWTAGRSRGIGIGPSGAVVGDGFFSDGSYHAVLFGDSAAIDLGTLGGTGSGARDITAGGTIVGWAADADESMHAFIYRSGAMTDLNTLIDPNSGWTLNVAYRVNDQGQIAGSGTINGQQHAFLLTPVPEPTVMAVMAVAVLLVGRRRRESM